MRSGHCRHHGLSSQGPEPVKAQRYLDTNHWYALGRARVGHPDRSEQVGCPSFRGAAEQRGNKRGDYVLSGQALRHVNLPLLQT